MLELVHIQLACELLCQTVKSVKEEHVHLYMYRTWHIRQTVGAGEVFINLSFFQCTLCV